MDFKIDKLQSLEISVYVQILEHASTTGVILLSHMSKAVATIVLCRKKTDSKSTVLRMFSRFVLYKTFLCYA